MLDRHRIPDRFPFVVDDDGTMGGCRRLNQYLLDAWDQNAFDLGSMRRFHVYHLARLLRFVRRYRTGQVAADAGVAVPDWLAEHGEPRLDLTDAARADLNAYRQSRASVVQQQSWKTEAGCLSGFFRYATEMGWMDSDPVSRWAGRNTFAGRGVENRTIRFLTEGQLRLFLNVGLRGDAPAEASMAPAYPERDYAFGLVLAATGLRREEGALLLAAEIPAPERMPPGGVWPFVRYGKGGRPRSVYASLELVHAIDLYRRPLRQRRLPPDATASRAGPHPPHRRVPRLRPWPPRPPGRPTRPARPLHPSRHRHPPRPPGRHLMPSPVRKQVTDVVMQRVSDAIDALSSDPGARRTKRELERIAGIGHDAVARAFRRDAAENSRWNLTGPFAALTDPAARRRSPQEQQVHELQHKLREKNAKIAELETTLDRFAMAVLAHHLELAEPAPGADVISLGRNRIRR